MSNTTTQVPDDQLTPRDVIIKVIEIKDALLKNWKVLILFSVIGGAIGYALDFYLRSAKEYEATMVFNLGGSSGGDSGMGGLASLVGLGGTPDANIFTGENFFYFVTSRPVIERTLMKHVTINGQKYLLANVFVDSSGIKEKEWKGREDLAKFQFPKDDSVKFDMTQRILMNQLVEKAQKATGIKELGSKSSFISLSATTENANLSIMWLDNLLATVEEVYTENQTRKTRKTLKLLERRADSLAAILSNTETKLARALYNNTQIIIPEAKIPANKLERSTSFIQSLYTEAVASAERMRVSLVREAPLFTVIEDVKLPLDAKSNEQTRLKIGILSGFLLALVYVYFKSVFNSISKSKA
jgi:hypothetical protein